MEIDIAGSRRKRTKVAGEAVQQPPTGNRHREAVSTNGRGISKSEMSREKKIFNEMETKNEQKLPIDKLDELRDEQMLSLKGGHCDQQTTKEVEEGSGPGCGCGCGCGC